jgi:RNA recognition motif-containing protein
VKPSKTLLISGVNLEATEVDLFKFFSEKGTLIECQLKKDQFQRSLGKAKVSFDRLEDSEKAFKELNGTEYKGQLLQIRYFSEKKPETKVDNKFNRKTKF